MALVPSVVDHTLSFIGEFFDKLAEITRQYQVIFHANDNTIEMYDMKSRKMFLKKTPIPSVKLEDFYIGSTVTILGRQLHIIDFGDPHTKAKLDGQREETLALIKEDALDRMGKIIDIIYRDGFRVFKLKKFRLSSRDLDDFAAISKKSSRDYTENVIALVLQTERCVKKWKDLMGPSSPAEARRTTIDSLRSQFGTDNVRNAVYGSNSVQDASDEISFFFSGKRMFATTATFRDCTCCIIKPHAVLSGKAGLILDAIREGGFEITALELFDIVTENAEEFFEIYKGVSAVYLEMVSELTSGPCIALEVKKQGVSEIVQAFREFCGPSDAQIAQRLRPNSLRARFGVDRIKNAVHCTDLPEDGVLEVEYFFKILQD